MFLAGLYDECSRADDPLDITSRFALVTTKANAEMKWLTDRQPVILSTAADVNAWLDVSSGLSFPQLHHLFEPHDQSDLEKKLTWYVFPSPLHYEPEILLLVILGTRCRRNSVTHARTPASSHCLSIIVLMG